MCACWQITSYGAAREGNCSVCLSAFPSATRTTTNYVTSKIPPQQLPTPAAPSSKTPIQASADEHTTPLPTVYTRQSCARQHRQRHGTRTRAGRCRLRARRVGTGSPDSGRWRRRDRRVRRCGRCARLRRRRGRGWSLRWGRGCGLWRR